MKSMKILWAALIVMTASALPVWGQAYGEPDRDQPGDAMIQAYLARRADELDATFLQDVANREQWDQLHARYTQEYLYMLGLWPLPEKTPLQATVTGTLRGDGYVVEMLHYQSRPGLYVTANLYRPAAAPAGERFPAVLYVCGHSSRGRDGNKTAYQSHGIWFARHGYVCLILDTLQRGEIASVHHGTYSEQRWWWLSRGYTPAGVECWNGVRAIDYLASRADVDADRIAVTGISGGGAATFWITAADVRVKVAVPVSGMADLSSYVGNRVINGHCDCMFLHNAYRWPWTRIAALIAPRPLLFANSDQDVIFPMDANGRITNRLERVYSLYGAGDLVDSVVSIGDHNYRDDLRRAAYRFINTHLKHDPRAIEDSEVDLVSGSESAQHPIPPEKLRVFPEDADIPADAKNTTADQWFVPRAESVVPTPESFDTWRRQRLTQLRDVSFGYFPERIPSAQLSTATPAPPTDHWAHEQITTEEGIEVPLWRMATGSDALKAQRALLVVVDMDELTAAGNWITDHQRDGDAVYFLQPRGVGPTRWTRTNPPNYVERAHVLVGNTVETGQVWDVIAASRLLRSRYAEDTTLCVAGQRGAAILAAYAALWEPDITEALLDHPPMSHQDPSCPNFLNVLRVCDVPDVLAMLAPRRLMILGCGDKQVQHIQAGYRAGSAEANLSVQ